MATSFSTFVYHFSSRLQSCPATHARILQCYYPAPIDAPGILQHVCPYSLDLISSLEMWQRPSSFDDPFRSPLPQTPSSIAYKWANRVGRPPRFSGLRLTPFRFGIFLLAVGSIVLIRDRLPTKVHANVSRASPIACCVSADKDSLRRINLAYATPLLFPKLPSSLRNPAHIESQIRSTPSSPTSSEIPAMFLPSICTPHSARYAMIDLQCSLRCRLEGASAKTPHICLEVATCDGSQRKKFARSLVDSIRWFLLGILWYGISWEASIYSFVKTLGTVRSRTGISPCRRGRFPHMTRIETC
jgi:hypothetical protein